MEIFLSIFSSYTSFFKALDTDIERAVIGVFNSWAVSCTKSSTCFIFCLNGFMKSKESIQANTAMASVAIIINLMIFFFKLLI